MRQPTAKELALRVNQEGTWKRIRDPETGRMQIAFEPPSWFRLLTVEKQVQVLGRLAEASGALFADVG